MLHPHAYARQHTYARQMACRNAGLVTHEIAESRGWRRVKGGALFKTLPDASILVVFAIYDADSCHRFCHRWTSGDLRSSVVSDGYLTEREAFKSADSMVEWLTKKWAKRINKVREEYSNEAQMCL